MARYVVAYLVFPILGWVGSGWSGLLLGLALALALWEQLKNTVEMSANLTSLHERVQRLETEAHHAAGSHTH